MSSHVSSFPDSVNLDEHMNQLEVYKICDPYPLVLV
jgi:hypothetical protein